jgi:nucleotidyltransferase/DNA polymerase involved in DNA repair
LDAHAAPGRGHGDGLLAALRGVPKCALMGVLGDELGERAWRHSRGKACWPEGAVADAEIAAGLVRHLCGQAATELRSTGKRARFVRLTVRYQDGRSACEQAQLPQLTQDAGEIAETAASLLPAFTVPPALLQSVDLHVTTAGDLVAEPVQTLPWFTAPPQPALA